MFWLWSMLVATNVPNLPFRTLKQDQCDQEFSGFEADELDELPRAAVRPQPLNFQTSCECAWLKDFDEATGIRFDTDGMTEAEVFMKLLDGEETVVRLVNETNRYARQYIQKVGIENLRQHSLANTWTETNVPEMKAFLSILLLMGFVKFPSYQDYWSTEKPHMHQIDCFDCTSSLAGN